MLRGEASAPSALYRDVAYLWSAKPTHGEATFLTGALLGDAFSPIFAAPDCFFVSTLLVTFGSIAPWRREAVAVATPTGARDFDAAWDSEFQLGDSGFCSRFLESGLEHDLLRRQAR